MGEANGIRFQCPHCSKRLRVGAKFAGRRMPCPNQACRQPIDIPMSQDNEPATRPPSRSGATPELPDIGSVTVLMPNTVNAGVTADQVVDFIQWGAGAQPNEAVAAAAGVWVTGGVVPQVPLARAFATA